tara:strand:+ start:305 stop:1090 length:786 start_codon:yes stop_codon:yes gene_type:complete
MHGKYHLTDVIKPDIIAGTAAHTATAFSAGDCVFGWTPFEIPRGTVALKSIVARVYGTDGVDVVQDNIELYFAKSINGVAPFALDGLIHTSPIGLVTNLFKNNIIGNVSLNWASATDGLNAFSTYNILSSARTSSILDGSELILENNDLAYEATKGYQTIWVAGMTAGTPDFGTGVLLNQASDQAADTSGNDVVLTVDGTDNTTIFAIGDKLVGGTGGPTMEVTGLVSSTSIKVKNITEQIDDDEELIHLNPITLRFGFRY